VVFEIVEAMLELAQMKKGDVVYEENCSAYFRAGHSGFWMLVFVNSERFYEDRSRRPINWREYTSD
jgi:hypothetical protein